MKLKAIIILLIITCSIIPLYFFYKYIQRIIRPKESMGRLFLYLMSGFALVFIYSFLIGLLVKMLFPTA